MQIVEQLKLFLYYNKMGKDLQGNVYYQSKIFDDNLKIYRRRVNYNGMAEPSKIPQVWHAWLHYMIEEIPEEKDLKTYKWQKEHLPNFTGTDRAYFPDGHIRNGGKRKQVSSDYIQWKPGV